MRSQGVYGQKLGDHFQLERAPSIVTSNLRRSEIGVTRIQCHRPSLTSPIPSEDAYLIAFQIDDCVEHELWINGRGSGRLPLFAGQTSIYDLRCNPIAHIRESSNCVMYYIPKAVFDTLAEDIPSAKFNELNAHDGRPNDDPIISGLTAALLPAFENPDYASQLFLDHLTLAVATHLAGRYGNLTTAGIGDMDRLPAHIERRAKEMIDASLAGEIPLVQLARECGMSARNFSHAFRRTVGFAPHHWMAIRRCDLAKGLMRTTLLTLEEIALACGFADEVHFTRSFLRVAHTTPGAWRRATLEA